MRVLYVSTIRLASRTGDTEHVLNVCRELAQQGVAVNLVAIGSPATKMAAGDSGLTIHPVDIAGESGIRAVRGVARVARHLTPELRPDIVYVRPFPLDWLFLLRHLRRWQVKYVSEFNTFTSAEYRSKGQPLRGRIYEWFDRASIRDAAGIVTVTEELARWANRLAGVSKSTLVAGNGVNLEAVPFRSPAVRALVRKNLQLSTGAFALAMAGFGSPWHGFDRAIQMLAHTASNVELWLIGAHTAEASEPVRKMARGLGLENRLRVFPRLDANDLADVLAAADVGIGPLALDRNDMREAQPIKVRLYLASGLPVLYNHVDAKLDPALPFLSFVGSTNPGELAAGLEKLARNPPDRAAIRAYAMEQLSWAAIAAETHRFLASLLDSTNT